MGLRSLVSRSSIVIPKTSDSRLIHVLCSILWTALFGIFGKIYIPDHPTPEQGAQIRMKHAVWIDLINMLLWLVTFVYGLFIWFRRRNNTTMHTGRAHV